IVLTSNAALDRKRPQARAVPQDHTGADSARHGTGQRVFTASRAADRAQARAPSAQIETISPSRNWWMKVTQCRAIALPFHSAGLGHFSREAATVDARAPLGHRTSAPSDCAKTRATPTTRMSSGAR